MSTLLEPFQFSFFVNAIVVATIAGALLGAVGVYVVLRGMSYIGHGLSHAIFGWAVISAVVSVNFFVGAGLGGFASALMVDRVARRRTIGADAAIGVVTTAVFAIGIALISAKHRFVRNFEAALFGQVLGVTHLDIVIVIAVALAVAAFFVLAYRGMLFATFDPDVAAASGVPVARLNAGLALTLAASIVATMQVLGVLLVAAALVIPAVIARLLTDSFPRMMWLSTAIGALAGLVGVYLSWYLNIGSGATIVLVEAVGFLAAYVLTAARGRKMAVSGAHI